MGVFRINRSPVTGGISFLTTGKPRETGGDRLPKSKRCNTQIVFHFFCLQVTNDVNGLVLLEIFRPGSKFAKRKIKYVDVSCYAKSEDKN